MKTVTGLIREKKTPPSETIKMIGSKIQYTVGFTKNRDGIDYPLEVRICVWILSAIH